MVRWVRPPQHPSPKPCTSLKVLLIFFRILGRSSTGRWISFFSLTDVFQGLIGEDLNRTCRKWCLLALLLFVVRRWSRSNGVYITGSGVSYVCIWVLLQCTPYHQFFFLIIQRSQPDVLFWYFWKKIFSPELYLFLGANVVFRSLFCFGSSLSKTDLIFLTNIVSAGETASGIGCDSVYLQKLL